MKNYQRMDLTIQQDNDQDAGSKSLHSRLKCKMTSMLSMPKIQEVVEKLFDQIDILVS